MRDSKIPGRNDLIRSCWLDEPEIGKPKAEVIRTGRGQVTFDGADLNALGPTVWLPGLDPDRPLRHRYQQMLPNPA